MVLVKKANGQWRVCVNFTNPNNVCLKDYFSLSQIDQLIESIVDHQLSFIKVYSSYNQIDMHQLDQKHALFITDRGLYCYMVIPFELKNTGAIYQRLVN